jgi:hypothetical protein
VAIERQKPSFLAPPTIEIKVTCTSGATLNQESVLQQLSNQETESEVLTDSGQNLEHRNGNSDTESREGI